MSKKTTPLIYKPPVSYGLNAEITTMGVKFCNDTFLLKSFLDQNEIVYKLEELEMSPLGLGLRIKKNKDKNV